MLAYNIHVQKFAYNMSYALTDHVPVTYADRVSSLPTTPPLFISLYRARALSLSLSLSLSASVSLCLSPPPQPLLHTHTHTLTHVTYTDRVG